MLEIKFRQLLKFKESIEKNSFIKIVGYKFQVGSILRNF